MTEIEGNIGGEVKIDPIKFLKIIKKKAMKNNETSAKVLVPRNYEDEEVVVLLPKLKSGKK